MVAQWVYWPLAPTAGWHQRQWQGCMVVLGTRGRPQGRKARRDVGGGVPGWCSGSVPRGGVLPSLLVWVVGSCRTKLAAKGARAAWVRRADHRAMDACTAADRKMCGTERLRAWASKRRNSAASWLHLPPTSMAETTRRHRLPRTSSG